MYFKTRLELTKFLRKANIRSETEFRQSQKSRDALSDDFASDLQRIFPASNSRSPQDEAGFIGKFIDLIPYDQFDAFTEQIEARFNQIWFGETIMRGPLIFSKMDYLAEGGFNVDAFFQGNDDHDIFVRIKQKGKLVGFTPIHFSSPIYLGNARQKRKIRSKIWSKFHRFARRNGLLQSALYREAMKVHG